MSDLIPVAPEELPRIPGFATVSKKTANFPRRSTTAAQLRTRQRQAITSTAPPVVRQPPAKKIAATRLTAAQLTKLRAVRQSDAPTAEIVAQKLDPEQTLGIVYSAITTLEYSKLKAERQARLRRRGDREKVEAQWARVVEGAQQAFAAAGLGALTEAGLDRMEKELSRSRANFNAVVEIANSAADVVATGGPKLAFGNYVTIAERLKDFLDPIVTPVPPNLCDRPVEGKYTRHFGYSFALSVRLTVWCPTWTNPFRTCTKTFTIAGVSFSLDLEVGYRITCCGATAYGAAYAQACGTIIGITVCAACSAKVTGVAGVSRSGSGSSCTYGLAVTAELKCTLGGITVFYATAPYGWTVTGPCPPASFPC